jgi:hypothetical protein
MLMQTRDFAGWFLAVAAVFSISAQRALADQAPTNNTTASREQPNASVESGTAAPAFQEASPEGYLSLTRQALIDRLKLNLEQAVVIGCEITTYQTELRELYGNWPPGAQDREGELIRQRLTERHAALRNVAVGNIAAVLSLKQRETLATLSDLYSDEASPPRKPGVKTTPISLKKSPDATIKEEGQGLMFVMQNYRDGTMVQVRGKDLPQDTRKIDIAVNSSGVFFTTGGRRQKQPYWHSADRVITAVALSPNGKRVATGTGWFPNRSNLKTPGEIRIWDVASGALLQQEFFSEDVYALGFSDDDSLLVGLEPRGGR